MDVKACPICMFQAGTFDYMSRCMTEDIASQRNMGRCIQISPKLYAKLHKNTTIVLNVSHLWSTDAESDARNSGVVLTFGVASPVHKTALMSMITHHYRDDCWVLHHLQNT